LPPRRLTFEDVRTIGHTIPGVGEGTAYGSPALTANGRMFACVPTNKQAEPNSLMVRVSVADREEMLAAAPDVYYLKPHYEPYPAILVRLSKIRRDALTDLLKMSVRFIAPRPSQARKRKSPR
jgi:hypothetical protein